MNVTREVIRLKVTKKALKEFKEIVEAESGQEVVNPSLLLQSLLQHDVRLDLAHYAFQVTDSGCLKHDWPGLKKPKKASKK